MGGKKRNEETEAEAKGSRKKLVRGLDRSGLACRAAGSEFLGGRRLLRTVGAVRGGREWIGGHRYLESTWPPTDPVTLAQALRRAPANEYLQSDLTWLQCPGREKGDRD